MLSDGLWKGHLTAKWLRNTIFGNSCIPPNFNSKEEFPWLSSEIFVSDLLIEGAPNTPCVMYVCTYVCMYICISMSEYAHIYVCLYEYGHTCIYF